VTSWTSNVVLDEIEEICGDCESLVSSCSTSDCFTGMANRMFSKIRRTETGRQVVGNVRDNTDGAHKMGFDVLNGVLPDRKYTLSSMKKVQQDLNRNSNVRLTTPRQNRKVDKRRDGRIIEAVNTNGPLVHQSTAQRARQIYQANIQANTSAVRKAAQKIGNLPVRTGAVGRPKLVKNISRARTPSSSSSSSSSRARNKKTGAGLKRKRR
jgi:hypothetical protein